MFTVYLIDYYKSEQNNGLNSYINELKQQKLIQKYGNLRIIFLNSIHTKELLVEVIDGISIYYIPPVIININEDNIKYLTQLEKVILSIIHHEVNDNIVLHFNWIDNFDLIISLQQHTNCKIVLTKHCIPWRDMVTNNYTAFYALQKAFEQGKKAPFLDAKLKKEQFGYDFVDHIITVTQCAKQSLTQLFEIPPHKITVVNNGLSVHAIPIYSTPKNISLRKKYGFSANDKLVLYAGNVNPRKGIFDVVKAFAHVLKLNPDACLLIAGPGNYEGIIKLSKGSWGRITLLGSLDKATLYDLYNIADVGIVPSYIEQCSYTCIEMMQAGLPLLVSDVDGLKEMVNEDCGLRFKVDFKKNGASINQKDFVNKLSYLLNHPKGAKQLGKNARKYALQYFTAERMAKETVAVYEKSIPPTPEGGIEKLKVPLEDVGDNPLATVLLPVYNAEKYLQECLDSILCQTYPHFELLVINDGSTDRSHQIITAYTDSRLVYINNPANQGVARTLNQGLSMAKGKYIARIDADDLMMPQRLEKQVAYMEANPGCVLLGSGHYLVGEKGLPFDRFQPPVAHHAIKTALLFYNCMSHPTVMYRSEIVKKQGYSEEFAHCEDYELWLRMATMGQLANLPEALTQYRVHGNNLSLTKRKAMQQNVMELLAATLDNLAIDYTPEQLMAHCSLGFGIAGQYFNSQERIEALNNWLDLLEEKLPGVGYSKPAFKHFFRKILNDINKKVNK